MISKELEDLIENASPDLKPKLQALKQKVDNLDQEWQEAIKAAEAKGLEFSEELAEPFKQRLEDISNEITELANTNPDFKTSLENIAKKTKAPNKLPRLDREGIGYWRRQLQQKNITEKELRELVHPDSVNEILRRIEKKVSGTHDKDKPSRVRCADR